jgi:hypothetical protein
MCSLVHQNYIAEAMLPWADDLVNAMKIGIIGCLAGSVAALLFNGCASDPYATTDTYGTGYTPTYATTTTTEPVFVERRIVTVNRTPRDVPIYRTGNTYFYTYGGRRYSLAGYPEVSPLTPTTRVVGTRAYSSGRYRTADRTVIRRDNVDDVAVVPATTRTTTIVEPEVIGEPAPVTTYRDSKEVVEIRD